MKFLFPILILLISTWGYAEVWPHKAEWSIESERIYSHFVEKNVDTEFVKNNLPGAKVDCADFVYLVRAIFARRQGLEFFVYDEESKTYLSSKTSNFDSILDPELRFSAFMNSVFKLASTWSLAYQTQLTPINRNEVKPGIILLTDQSRSHSWLIKKVFSSGQAQLIYATEPSSDWLYDSLTYPTEEFAFPRQKAPTKDQGGFRRFLWPNEFLDRQKLAFSNEQNLLPIQTYFSEVQKRLQITPTSDRERFTAQLDELCNQVRIRVNAVLDALVVQGEACMPAKRREQLSTVSRDSRILNLLNLIQHKYRPAYSDLYQSYFTLNDNQSSCLVTWADNRIEPLGKLRLRFLMGQMSSDAEESLAVRWGEELGPSERVLRCGQMQEKRSILR